MLCSAGTIDRIGNQCQTTHSPPDLSAHSVKLFAVDV